MTIAAFVPNLFDRSRFQGQVEFIENASELDKNDYSLVVIDLDRCSEVAEYCQKNIKVIGFGSHVDSKTMKQAVEDGCELVMARSVFFKKLPDLGALANQ